MVGDVEVIEQNEDIPAEEIKAEDDDQPITEDAPTVEDEGDEGAEDSVVVTIGDEAAPAEEDESKAAPWVRELRKTQRETVRKLRQVEAENARLKAGQAPAAETQPLGDKPKLADFGFDEDAHDKALDAWHERKRAADERERTTRQQQEQQQAQWQKRLDAVSQAGTSLRVSDYEEASQAFDDSFSVVQRGIVFAGPDNPKDSALLRYALGKNPVKAKELAAIDDPVKFAFAIADLRSKLKVTPRKAAPPPERTVRSSVAGVASVDNTLQKLRDEANKTGDLTKLMQYKADQRKKQTA